MNLRPARINTDLHLLHTQIPHPPRFRFADHHSVGLDSDVECQSPRVFQDLEKITPHQNFATTESQEKSPSLSQLLQNIFDLAGGHLAVIIVIQMANINLRHHHESNEKTTTWSDRKKQDHRRDKQINEITGRKNNYRNRLWLSEE